MFMSFTGASVVLHWGFFMKKTIPMKIKRWQHIFCSRNKLGACWQISNISQIGMGGGGVNKLKYLIV